MNKIVVEGKTREKKSGRQQLKKAGLIPGVVYGKETKTMPIEIKVKDIEKTVKTLSEGALLITLKLTDNKEEKTVIIQEVQRDPKTDNILHADFHQVEEKVKSEFHVPVFSKGSAEGVKMGGTLEHSLREVTVKCLPADLPEKFELDISGMQMGDDLTVSDLKVPERVEIQESPDKVLFAIIAPRKEEPKPEEEEAAAGEEAKEPEVIGEKKEEEKEKEEKK